MTSSPLSRKNWREAHREVARRRNREYRISHREKIRALGKNRYQYLKKQVKAIVLNDDPESLLYAGNFKEVPE